MLAVACRFGLRLGHLPHCKDSWDPQPARLGTFESPRFGSVDIGWLTGGVNWMIFDINIYISFILYYILYILYSICMVNWWYMVNCGTDITWYRKYRNICMDVCAWRMAHPKRITPRAPCLVSRFMLLHLTIDISIIYDISDLYIWYIYVYDINRIIGLVKK